jgi:TatD DNase family protein
MYRGTYHSKTFHEPDLDVVLRRAYDAGVRKAIGLAGTIDESERLLDLISDLDFGATTTTQDDAGGEDGGASRRVLVFGTVGVHPTRCAEAFAEEGRTTTSNDGADGESPSTTSWIPKTEHQTREVIRRLIDVANRGKESGRVVAIGECGLDYARVQFCSKEVQRIGLLAQLDVARATGLPLYLHNRESGDDLYEILSGYDAGSRGRGLRGVVHSFDESIEIANKFLSLGLYIGINGCSLKTAENIETMKSLPLDRMILETDCPWCDIRPTHAGWGYVRTSFPTMKEKRYNRELGREYCVKNRTEPCHVAQVAEVVAGVRGIDVEEVVRVCGRNVHDLFGSLERKR